MSRTAAATPEQRYTAVVVALHDQPGVTQSRRPGFGVAGLWVRGRVFAGLVRGRLLVKLPRQRVDALVASGEGERFDPGHGRQLREWLSVPATSRQDWVPLACEALEFVASER